jgi:hypothetical protein
MFINQLMTSVLQSISYLISPFALNNCIVLYIKHNNKSKYILNGHNRELKMFLNCFKLSSVSQLQ